MKKPTIFATAQVYLPGHLAGGPVRSLSGLVERLAPHFDWKILTTDRDLGAQTPYPGIEFDRWTRVGNADVWYASSERGSVRNLINVIRNTPHDLLYLNSFFNPLFSISPAWAMKFGLLRKKPMLIAPRGEFSAGALNLKRLKKKVYVTLSAASACYQNAFWHASTVDEASDIQVATGGQANRIFVAPNMLGSAMISYSNHPRGRGEPLRVCFLSRIARMKNLDYALRALAMTSKPIRFSVFGPKEDGQYWGECEALVERLPPNVEFSYGGSVASANVQEILSAQDLFFLPTRGENFGHALVEAWGAGLPVLTSDCTPWRGLESKGVGWDMPLGDDGISRFAKCIDMLAAIDEGELESMRCKAKSFADSICHDPDSFEKNRNMFLRALA